LERIEKFVERFYKSEIKPMTDSEFDSQIHSLVESLVEAPSSLGREAKDLWSEVTENRFMWDFNERIKREITSQFVGKKTKINQLIETLFINSKNRRIVVGVNGKLSK
jgi:secreted Zn-dependent insulinase-like peptidase